MDDTVRSEVCTGSWRFSFDDTSTLIDVENCTHPYQRLKVPCPQNFRHSDLESFARGWMACVEYL